LNISLQVPKVLICNNEYLSSLQLTSEQKGNELKQVLYPTTIDLSLFAALFAEEHINIQTIDQLYYLALQWSNIKLCLRLETKIEALIIMKINHPDITHIILGMPEIPQLNPTKRLLYEKLKSDLPLTYLLTALIELSKRNAINQIQSLQQIAYHKYIQMDNEHTKQSLNCKPFQIRVNKFLQFISKKAQDELKINWNADWINEWKQKSYRDMFRKPLMQSSTFTSD
jgi:hypothetical protein